VCIIDITLRYVTWLHCQGRPVRVKHDARMHRGQSRLEAMLPQI